MQSKIYTKRQLARARFFVGLKGAELRAINGDGEIIWEVGLQPGMQFADQYQPYLADGDQVELIGAGTLQGQSGIGRLRPHCMGRMAAQSGANPDYRPDPVTASERRLQMMMQQVTQASAKLDKRMRTFERISAKAKDTTHAQEVIETPAETTEQGQEQQQQGGGAANPEQAPQPAPLPVSGEEQAGAK